MSQQRSITIGAAAVGLLAVAVFLVLSQRGNDKKYAPTIIDQREVSQPKTGLRGIVITARSSPLFNRLPYNGEAFEYRIVDASRQIYAKADAMPATAPSPLFVPLGYGKPIESPKLELWMDEDRLSVVPLAPFPKPAVHPLVCDPVPRIRAYSISGADLHKIYGINLSGESALRFEPVSPLGPNDDWTIEVLETDTMHQPPTAPLSLPGRVGSTPVSAINPAIPDKTETMPAWGTYFFYADQASAVKLRMSRRIKREASEVISATEFTVGPNTISCKSGSLANRLGLDIKLKAPNKGSKAGPVFSVAPDRALFKPNEIPESIDCSMVSPKKGLLISRTAESNEFSGFPRPPDRDQSPFKEVKFNFYIVKRKAGVESIPVQLKVTKHWFEVIETFETTVPISK